MTTAREAVFSMVQSWRSVTSPLNLSLTRAWRLSRGLNLESVAAEVLALSQPNPVRIRGAVLWRSCKSFRCGSGPHGTRFTRAWPTSDPDSGWQPTSRSCE